MSRDAGWHPHVYFTHADRAEALALREIFRSDPAIRFIG